MSTHNERFQTLPYPRNFKPASLSMSSGVRNQATCGTLAQSKQARVTARSSYASQFVDWHKWLPITILACVATLNFVGLLLVSRRFSGALLEPFPTGQMLFTALITTTLAATSRNAWRRAKLARNNQKKEAYRNDAPRSRLDHGAGWDQWVGWGSSSGLILMAVGCVYPAKHLGDWLIWLPLLVADQFWRQSFFDGGKPTAPFDRLSSNESKDIVSTTDSISDSRISDRDEQILQQLFRVRNKAGHETIYGTLRADFNKGQRNVSLYVGFCPPLPHPPQVEAEPIDGPAATLKVVQNLAHGTRVDLRLDQPAEQECHVLVDLAALSTG